ncbi:MAG TPA: periplasmic heavy metal sensor [Thermoanaerobaculia bacterium]|jgi:Spy/CpxP family protein refolding chaperone
MSRWWLIIALLLSVGLNVGILAAIGARRAAAPPGPQGARPQQQAGNPGNGDPVPRLARLADRLKLEGDQRRKFLDIQWNLYQETTRLRLDLAEIHRALRRELTRPDPDRQRVEGLLNESSRLYLALERSLVNNVFATRDLLGPEKETEYLKIVGRLRVPNPGPGLANPTAESPQQRPGGFLERMRQRRLRQQQRRGQGQPPNQEQDQGPNGPP